MTCSERRGRRGSVHLAAASDYRSARRPDQQSAARAEPGHAASVGELVTDTATEFLENYVTGVWLIAGAVPGVLRAAGRRLRGMGEPDQLPQAAASMSGPVPRTVFNAPLTERRAVAFASIPLADMKTVNNAFGGSTPTFSWPPAHCPCAPGATPRRRSRRSAADAGAAIAARRRFHHR